MCVLEKSHVCMFVLEWCEINSLDGFRMIYLDIETISPKHHQRHFLLPRETRCFLRCPGSMDSHHFRAAWKITIRYCRKLPCPVATQRTESGCFVMLCFVRVFLQWYHLTSVMTTAGLSLSFPGVAARCNAVTISWSVLFTLALPSLIRIYINNKVNRAVVFMSLQSRFVLNHRRNGMEAQPKAPISSMIWSGTLYLVTLYFHLDMFQEFVFTYRRVSILCTPLKSKRPSKESASYEM